MPSSHATFGNVAEELAGRRAGLDECVLRSAGQGADGVFESLLKLLILLGELRVAGLELLHDARLARIIIATIASLAYVEKLAQASSPQNLIAVPNDFLNRQRPPFHSTA